jgi:serine protease Do
LKLTTASSLALAAVLGIGSLTPTIALAQVPAQGEAPSGAQAGNGHAMATVEGLSRAFRNVGKDIEPTVVSIKVRKVIEPSNRRMMPNDPFFRRFFGPGGHGDEEDEDSDVPGFPGMPFGGEQIGQGAGVVVAVDGNTGYIVTNNHVAGEADEMEISLNDGRTITNGKLVGKDPRTDLAVVKIEASNLKAAKWGNSDELEKGDWVLAFGSPFGYVGSMTHGIVSATNRNDLRIIPQGYEAFIQIDAPINPGNSGGPLVSLDGRVVGIDVAGSTNAENIGFAVAVNAAKALLASALNV